MKRKLTCLLLIFCMLFAAGGATYASNGGHQENGEETQGVSDIVTVVQLTIKASHYAMHRSYTRTVHRQGIKHIIKYEAIPKSQCPLCKLP